MKNHKPPYALSRSGRLSSRGFTLAEMAVVVLLMGIAMSMGLKMLTANLDNTAYSETKSKQERIKNALIGFLRTNGRLPCPDNAAAVATGAEVSPCNANATSGYGIIPWRTLGIPRDTGLDGWGNYFTYRVANGIAPVVRNWSSQTVGTPFDINQLAAPGTALTIQELNAAGTALVTTTNQAVVVILSHGKNGYGAKTTQVAARNLTAGAGAGEITNATGGSTSFVLRSVTEVATAFNGAYDDLVTYMTPQDLLQPLMSEKTIKACPGYCLTTPCPGTNVCTATNVPVGLAAFNCTCVAGEPLPR